MENQENELTTEKLEAETIVTTQPRENLVNTAVTFLSNQKIVNQDQTLLKKFLIKKGLTEEEATIAFQRAGVAKSQSVNLIQQFSPQQFPSQQFPVQPFPPPPFPPPVPVHSRWQTIHHIITTATSVAGILYALYWLWKNYISPYLFGRKPKRKPVETTLVELEAAVGGCVEDVRSIRCSLQTLTDQRASELTNNVVVSRIQEVKSEVNSLKALLLNRNQFPAAPPSLGSGPLSIPAWQLSSEPTVPLGGDGDGEVEGEEEGNGSNGTTNGSDSSLEIVKDPNH